jgi:glycosyltransferase involved in cell wall biosynthesis
VTDAAPVLDVTVLIATRNRPDQLRGALAAVAAAAPAGTDVLVVDSAGDTEATRAVVAAAGVRYVRADRPGLSVARNVGVGHTSAAIVAFTDDDCRPRDGWLEALTAPFEDPAVGFVTGRVIGAGSGTAADVVDIGDERWRWPDDPVGMGSGANMAIRRAVLEEVGGFDPGIGAGAPIPSAEDHELFLRALHAGWEGRHAPRSVVDHDDRRGRWAGVRLCYGYGVGSGVVCRRASDLDPTVGRRMLRERLWDRGVRTIARDLRRGWEIPALRGLAMVLGVLRGRVRRVGRPGAAEVGQPRNR